MTATAPATRRRRPSPSTAPAPATLYLSIRDQLYAVRQVAADPAIARAAFRLLKPDGTLYDVTLTAHGPACDCPDFVFRRDGLDPAGCKHVQALSACGLIAAEPPRPRPQPGFRAL